LFLSGLRAIAEKPLEILIVVYYVFRIHQIPVELTEVLQIFYPALRECAFFLPYYKSYNVFFQIVEIADIRQALSTYGRVCVQQAKGIEKELGECRKVLKGEKEA
jgi:hypothetical protein